MTASRLHRSLNVDLPGGIADRLHFFGQFATKRLGRVAKSGLGDQLHRIMVVGQRDGSATMKMAEPSSLG